MEGQIVYVKFKKMSRQVILHSSPYRQQGSFHFNLVLAYASTSRICVL